MPRDLTGKTILVTGSNTGIGRATAEALAARGARLVLGCRSEEKTRPVVEAIRAAGGDARFHALDLSDLAAVRRSAQAFLDSGERLDVLVNNAGLARAKGLTKDGFETTFGVNHLGPFLFTTLLLPRLREAAPARIVNVASAAHFSGKPPADWESLRRPTKSFTGMPEYRWSKLANVLFTRELARGRAGAGVRSYALHPGVIASDIWRHVPWPLGPMMMLFMKTTEEGARSSIHCATSPEVAEHDGRYYHSDCTEKAPNPLAEDAALAKELWERSEAWTR
jgi:NAD(P)-dependent dehydrogenase (short-subunit alcohol dehydrogenase family)